MTENEYPPVSVLALACDQIVGAHQNVEYIRAILDRGFPSWSQKLNIYPVYDTRETQSLTANRYFGRDVVTPSIKKRH